MLYYIRNKSQRRFTTMSNANISPSQNPLYDIETEIALLGTFFVSRKNSQGQHEGQAAYLETKKAGLKSSHFYRPEHRTIYTAIEKLFNAGKMIDMVLIDEEIKDKSLLPLVMQINNAVGFTYNAIDYARKIIDLAERRELISKAELLRAAAADLDTPTEEIKHKSLLALAQEPSAGNTAHEPTCNDVMQMFGSEQKAPCYSTGLKGLDKILDGGLFPGLYVVGAISSLGKTSLCLQIADHIAAQGQDVLVFSLEMSKRELVAKSLSRIMATKDRSNAKTTRAILRGQNNWKRAEIDLLTDSIGEYAAGTGVHLYISVGMGDIGVADIRAAVIQHQLRTGNYPVVIVDYVQILAPADIRATDKQNTDKAVLELKRLSRDCNIPVVGISSFNRDNYTAPVNMAAFKESGSLEYSSDVLIGLQYDFMEPREGERKEARSARIEQDMKQTIADTKEGKPIIINAKVLKNRNGSKGTAIMQFTPMFNTFADVDTLHGEPVLEKNIPL
jgi:replicative DNA helicase